MKKILIILTILLIQAQFAFAQDDYSAFMQSLKLSQKQQQKIEAIEKKYFVQMGKLNAEIILRKMEIAQLKPMKNSFYKINSINAELELVQEELSEIQSKKNDEISSVLGIIQRFKFKRYCKTSKIM